MSGPRFDLTTMDMKPSWMTASGRKPRVAVRPAADIRAFDAGALSRQDPRYRGRRAANKSRRYMKEASFGQFLRVLFNILAGLTLADLLHAAGAGAGDWGTTGLIMLLYLSSVPLGALAFLIASDEVLKSVANPYARAFLAWAPFFVLGWVQWNVVVPAIRRGIRAMVRQVRGA